MELLHFDLDFYIYILNICNSVSRWEIRVPTYYLDHDDALTYTSLAILGNGVDPKVCWFILFSYVE